NPHGFPFESYDAIGAWRDIDNGQPVDTSANVFVDSMQVPISGAVEFVDLMAQSPGVHRCYTQHWVEYAVGHNATSDDQAAITRLGADSLAQQLSLQQLLVAVTTSPMFLNRAAQELP